MPYLSSYSAGFGLRRALLLMASLISAHPCLADSHESKAIPLPLVSAGTPQQQAAIAHVIRDYYEGIKRADRTKLERAFDTDAASMVGVVPDPDAPGSTKFYISKDITVSIDQWSSRDESGLGTGVEILAITMLDNRLASVALRYDDSYYDTLVLADINGVWKIIAKTFIAQ